MEKIITKSGDEVYIKKSKWFGWGVIHPIRINGKINWKNLIAGGNYIKTGFILILCFFIVMAIIEYYSNVQIAQKCLETVKLSKNLLK